jgi:hypothetical protein
MELGISEVTLSRWLRFPLPAEKRTAIVDAVHRINAKEA